MKDRFQESGPLSQRIAPLDLLAWLKSGVKKKKLRVSLGALVSYSSGPLPTPYTKPGSRRLMKLKSLSCSLQAMTLHGGVFRTTLTPFPHIGGDPSGFEWTRSVDFPYRRGPKWTRVDSKWTRSRMSFHISVPPKWSRSPFSIYNNKRQVSGESTWSPLRVQQRCNGSPCLQRGMLL